MARLRACMLVCALYEAMCTKWRIRNSRVLQKRRHGAEDTQGPHGAGVGLGPGSWTRRGQSRPLVEGEPGLWEVRAGGGEGPHTPVVRDGQFSKHLQDLDQALRLQLHCHGLLVGAQGAALSAPHHPCSHPRARVRLRGPVPDPELPAENVGPTRPAAESWSCHLIPL